MLLNRVRINKSVNTADFVCLLAAIMGRPAASTTRQPTLYGADGLLAGINFDLRALGRIRPLMAVGKIKRRR